MGGIKTRTYPEIKPDKLEPSTLDLEDRLQLPVLGSVGLCFGLGVEFRGGFAFACVGVSVGCR
jgi:hypothetical protein